MLRTFISPDLLMKRLLLLLFLVSCQVYAQTPLLENVEHDQDANVTYRVGGIGFGVSTMRDALLSPVLYRGFVIGAPTTKWQFRPSGWLRINSFENTLGIDASTAQSGKMITGFNFAFRQAFLKPLRPANGGFQLYAGPLWEGLGNLRTSIGNVNNVLSYDIGLGVGGSVLLRNNLTIGRTQLQVFNQISSILLGGYIRPQYGSSLPVVDEEKEKILLNTTAGSWNIHPNWDYRFSVDFYSNKYKNRFSRKNRKLLRQVAYRASVIWQYREFTETSKFQRGQTLFQIGPIVKL